MSSYFKFLYLPSNLDATNFFTNVKKPEQSIIKQTIIEIKNKLSNVFIINKLNKFLSDEFRFALCEYSYITSFSITIKVSFMVFWK